MSKPRISITRSGSVVWWRCRNEEYVSYGRSIAKAYANWVTGVGHRNYMRELYRRMAADGELP